MKKLVLNILSLNKGLENNLTEKMQKLVHYIIDKETTDGVLDYPNYQKFTIDNDENTLIGGAIFFDKFAEEQDSNDVCVELYDAYTNEYIDTIGFDDLDLTTQFSIVEFLFNYYILNIAD